MDVLGKLSFLDLPDVNTDPVLIADGGGIVSFAGGTIAARPAPGLVGRVYLATDTNRLFYDDGSVWIDTTQVPLIDGTANQVDVVDGTNVTPAIISIATDPILPGTGRVRLPVGTTAQRPASPAAGDVRFNSTTNLTEEYNGTGWAPVGRVLQVVTGNIPSATGSTQLPWDNTVPTATEGISIWSTTFTPLLATSRIVVEFTLTVATSTANRVATAQVRYGDSAIGAGGTFMAAANQPFCLAVRLVHTPGSTAVQTIQARVGLNGTGTLSVNQANGNNLAGLAVTQYTITEII